MIIHKGKKYTIETDGINAVKSDGSSSRSMKYYPERDVSAIAGEIDELTAWKILHDTASQMTAPGADKIPVSPDHILIDGDGFLLAEWSESFDQRFIAPEGYSPVWALGASVFYIFLGCHVFQGLGGKGQTPSAPVPCLRREMPELSNLISRCLDFDPANRPAVKEIIRLAHESIKRCESKKQLTPPVKPYGTFQVSKDQLDILWPENIC